MTLGAGTGPSHVRSLIEDFSARLEDLEREAVTIRVVIAALEGDQLPGPAATGRPADMHSLLAESPGIRASVLALILRQDVEAVRVELDRLQRAGFAERAGLGWKLTGR